MTKIRIRFLLLPLVACWLMFIVCATGTDSQKRETREYQGFYAELDSRSNVIGLVWHNDNMGCSNPVYAKGVITKVQYDGQTVNGFSVRYSDGISESFNFESFYNLPDSDRRSVQVLFRKGRRVGIRSRGCGSGLIPQLEIIKALR